MRSYPRNSPEAAARLVALMLVSDGHVCSSELEALARHDAARQLGLSAQAMQQVMQTLCEDLWDAAYASPSMVARLDDATLAALLAEVDDPKLRTKVHDLALAAARADRYLAEGEELILDAVRLHWGLGAKERLRELA
jgi:hypothetical protein